jgi:hypothetical protein
MARLVHPPKNAHPQNLPTSERMKLALQFLRDNRDEKATTAARTYHLNEGSVRKAWSRERNREGRPKGKGRGGAGWNRILRPDQHQAILRYAVDQATNLGRGATKQMMYNCAMRLRVDEGKQPSVRAAPASRWYI